jgi:hypothetical protein
MFGIGIDACEPAVLDRRDGAAPRRAHSAVGVKMFDGDDGVTPKARRLFTTKDTKITKFGILVFQNFRVLRALL